MPRITTVFWRDIPAQIIAEDGKGRKRNKIKLELSKRFMVSIDSAAMKSGSHSSDDYLQDWRKSDPIEISNEIEKEIKNFKENIEKSYNSDRLRKLIQNGGRKGIEAVTGSLRKFRWRWRRTRKSSIQSRSAGQRYCW